MSTKTSIKRIALVAVSALGFGLLSVMPAKADASNVAAASGSTTVVRTDVSGDTATLTIEANGAIGAAAELTLGSFTRNGLSLGSQVPTGFTWNWDDTNTVGTFGTAAPTNEVEAGSSAASAFASDAAANTVIGSASALESGDTIVVVTIANTAAQGKYTFTLDSDETGETAVTFTAYVSGAPSKTAFNKASYSALAGANASATIAVSDANGYNTYLKAGEAIAVTSSSISATSSVVLLDSGNYTKSVATTGTISTNLSASIAGTFTFTAGAASGQTLTAGTATLTTSAASDTNASLLKWISPTSQISGNAAAEAAILGTLDNDADDTDANEDTETVYVNPTQTSFSFRILAGANAVGVVKYTISASNVTTSPAAGSYTVSLTQNATASYADVTVTTSSIQAGSSFTFTADDAGGVNDPVYTVQYTSPVLASVVIEPDADTIAAKIGSTIDISATAYDQYGNTVSNAALFLSRTGRNGTAERAAISTDSIGVATWSLVDVSTSTSVFTDSYVVDNASGVGSINDTLDVVYKDDISAASMTGAGFINNGGTYNGVLLADGTTEVTIDQSNTAGTYSDQFYFAATLKNAAGNAVQGLPVVFTVTGGYITTETDTAAGSVTVGTLGKTSVTGYTDSNGVARAAVQVTKVGSVTVTATNGTLSKSASVTAITAANTNNRNISVSSSGAVVTATVTDGYGNPISGVGVTFTATNGVFLTGSNSVSGTTDANGKATASVQSGTGITVKASHTGGQSGSAVDSPVKGWAKAIASATTPAFDVGVTKSAEVLAAEAAEAAAKKAGEDAVAAANAATTEAKAATAAAEKAATDAVAAAKKAGEDAVAAAKAAQDAAVAEAKAAGEAAVAAAVKAALDAVAASKAAQDAAVAAAQKAATDAVAAAKAAQDAAVAQASEAYDASLEAIDAANAATDAANLAQESADAATVAAEEARDAADAATAAVEELATQMSTLFASLKAQITTLANTVAKIAKKVKA